MAWIGATLFILFVWRDLVKPIQAERIKTEFERARLDRMKAETEEIRFRSKIHSVPAGGETALLTPLPLQYAPPPPVYTPPPTPGEGGEGESINLLPVRDSAGRAVRYANIPPRALRRYSMEQFREIERLHREKPELTTSDIAARVLGHKGGYQNRVVGYIRGDNDPPWTETGS
ncbi:MAG: hypothetical protein ACLFRG_22130 [Desulfococcaceae bacterium]